MTTRVQRAGLLAAVALTAIGLCLRTEAQTPAGKEIGRAHV